MVGQEERPIVFLTDPRLGRVQSAISKFTIVGSDGLSALRDPVRLAYLCIHEPISLGKVQSKCHWQAEEEEAHLVPPRLVKA